MSTVFDHPDNAAAIVAGMMELETQSIGSINSGITFKGNILDVSSFAQILVGANGVLNGPNRYTLRSYSDPGGVNSFGLPPVWQDNTPSNKFMFMHPIGPYMSVEVLNSSGGAQGYGWVVFGMPTPVTPSLILPATQLAYASSSIANGTSIIVACSPQVNGQGVLGGNCGGAGMTAKAEVWNGTTWQALALCSSNIINQGNTVGIVLPFSDLRLNVFNLSGGVATTQGSISGPV